MKAEFIYAHKFSYFRSQGDPVDAAAYKDVKTGQIIHVPWGCDPNGENFDDPVFRELMQDWPYMSERSKNRIYFLLWRAVTIERIKQFFRRLIS